MNNDNENLFEQYKNILNKDEYLTEQQVSDIANFMNNEATAEQVLTLWQTTVAVNSIKTHKDHNQFKEKNMISLHRFVGQTVLDAAVGTGRFTFRESLSLNNKMNRE